MSYKVYLRLYRTIVPVLAAGFVLSCAAGAAEPPTGLDAARMHHREGRTDDALPLYRRVIDDPAQPVADRGTAANNACVILLDKGLYPAALEACQTARSLRLTLDDPPRLARTLNNLAAVLEASGQYDAARNRYLEALSINERLGDWESVAINLANLGVLATETGDYGSALSYYDRVEELAAAHDSARWAPVQRRLSTVNRGVVLERIGAFGEALETFRSIDTLSMAPDRAATVRINTGVAYRNLGDPFRALRQFELAAELIPAGDPAAGSNLWLDRALVHHLNLRDLDTAQTAYETALELADAGGAGSGKLQAVYYLARLELDRGRTGAAQTLFRQALDLAIANGALEGQWSAREGLARIALQNDRAGDAYEQLGQAMNLIETTRAGLDEGRLRLEFFGGQRSVYALAAEAAWQLLNETGDPAYSQAVFQISQRAKSRELLSHLSATHFVPATELRPAAGELMLEYFFGERYLYLSAWSQDGLITRRLGDAATVRAAVAATHTALQRTGQAAGRDELSARLTGPVADLLAGHSRLRIAPDGILFHIPFEILLANGKALLDSHIVSYTPSASVDRTIVDRGPARKLTFAGFGAVDPTGHRSAARYALPDLPGAAAELRELDRRLPGRHVLALAAAATESTFLDILAGGARIVHVATHTVFDDRLGPAIVLSPDGQSDGLLFPGEIVRASLNTDLTVLAACSTAIGGIEDGRAISSLTGALLSAGSRAVLATLWDVDDGYTAFFMQEFYRQLRQGVGAASALRNAKRTVRDNSTGDAAPWAAFVLIGDTGPLLGRTPDLRFLAAGLILLFGWWWLRSRNRKRRDPGR